MSNEHAVFGRHYDEVVVAFDMLLTAIIKVEVLNPNQFEMLVSRLEMAGFDNDQSQLVETFLRAIRTDD